MESKICTCSEEISCEGIICIYEFEGTFVDNPFWADWCPNSKTVYFGGVWECVKPWFVDAPPNETQVHNYVEKFGVCIYDEPMDDRHRDWMLEKINILKEKLLQNK